MFAFPFSTSHRLLLCATLATISVHAPAELAQAESEPTVAEERWSTAQSPDLHRLQQRIAQRLRSPKLRPSTTSIFVLDANSGELIYKHNEDLGLNPASNVKLVSTAAALDELGPEWRYQSFLLGQSPDAQGIVTGGVYLHGNFDPTLGVRAMKRLAASLRKKGVREIRGGLYTSDRPQRDTLATRSLNVVVHGSSPLQVEVFPKSRFVQVDAHGLRVAGRTRIKLSSEMATRSGDTLTSELPDPRDGAMSSVDDLGLHLRLEGTIRRGTKRRYRLPLRGMRPQFTLGVLREELEEAGITVVGGQQTMPFAHYNQELGRSGAIPFPLAVHRSRLFGELVKKVNKRSINWLADRLVQTAARHRYGGHLSMESGVRLMKEWLDEIGIDSQKVVLDTGSGLSYQSRMSTEQIAAVLRAAAGFSHETSIAENETTTFQESLAIAGVDGTLRRRFRTRGHELDASLRGKTGTLTGVIALSGFLHDDSGRTLCFSILSNGHPKPAKHKVRLGHEEIVGELEAYLHKLPPLPVPSSASCTSCDEALTQGGGQTPATVASRYSSSP